MVQQQAASKTFANNVQYCCVIRKTRIIWPDLNTSLDPDPCKPRWLVEQPKTLQCFLDL